MAPQEIHSESLEPANVTLSSKTNFADVIELRVSRWGDSPGFSGPHGITVVLARATRGQLLTVAGKETWPWKQRGAMEPRMGSPRSHRKEPASIPAPGPRLILDF